MEVKPGYKQTEVGMIPETWDARPLKDLCLKITDGDHATPNRTSSGYYLLSARNVLNGRIDVSDVDYVGIDEFRRMKRRCGPEENDVLISCSGTIGRVAVVPAGFECVLVRSAALAKPDREQADGVFLQYALQSTNLQSQIAASVNQGAQPNLFLNHIERLVCPSPPIPEQRAIAAALSDVDALLAGLDRLIAKKRDLKQAAMQQLLTGQTRLPGFQGEWEVKRLGDVIQKLVGGGTPSRSQPAYWGAEVPWVTVKDFATFNPRTAQESITRIGLENSASHLISAGTLITSTRMALGKAVIYEVDVAINQDLKAVFLKPGTSVRFLFCWFEFNEQVIDDLGSGSTVKGISIAELKGLPFPVISSAEQDAISDVLGDMDTELTALEARRAKTRALKQAMMQELLTGRTRLV